MFDLASHTGGVTLAPLSLAPSVHQHGSLFFGLCARNRCVDVFCLSSFFRCCCRWLTLLYFGLSKPNGGIVTDEDWQHFLETEISPKFPDGLTVSATSGTWRDSATGVTESERSKKVTLIHEKSSRSADAIVAISKSYIAAFDQQAVLVNSWPSDVRFCGNQFSEQHFGAPDSSYF